MPRAGQTGHHTFHDPGLACPDADWHPVTVSQDPEQSLALIFTQLGRDYGGGLPGFKPRAPLSPEVRKANRQRFKAWYETNKERAVARAAKWNQDNPEKRRQINREAGARYRAKMKSSWRVAPVAGHSETLG